MGSKKFKNLVEHYRIFNHNDAILNRLNGDRGSSNMGYYFHHFMVITLSTHEGRCIPAFMHDQLDRIIRRLNVESNGHREHYQRIVIPILVHDITKTFTDANSFMRYAFVAIPNRGYPNGSSSTNLFIKLILKTKDGKEYEYYANGCMLLDHDFEPLISYSQMCQMMINDEGRYITAGEDTLVISPRIILDEYHSPLQKIVKESYIDDWNGAFHVMIESPARRQNVEIYSPSISIAPELEKGQFQAASYYNDGLVDFSRVMTHYLH